MTATAMSLAGLTIYHVLIEAWSGTVKVARDSDLSGVELPPKAIMDDGRKHLVPKDTLSDLEKIRGAVHRLLAREGFRLVGGFAVPSDRVPVIEAELAKLNAEFNVAVATICDRLEDSYKKQETLHTSWAEVLRRGRLTAEQVRQRCRFAVAAVGITEPQSDAAGRFRGMVDEALPALIRSVAEEAEGLLTRITARGGIASVRSVNAAKRMLEKLERFSFLDPRVTPVVEAIGGQLDRIVTTATKLEPAEKAILVMVLSTMADPERFIGATPDDFAQQVVIPASGALFGQPIAAQPPAMSVAPSPVVAAPVIPPAPAMPPMAVVPLPVAASATPAAVPATPATVPVSPVVVTSRPSETPMAVVPTQAPTGPSWSMDQLGAF